MKFRYLFFIFITLLISTLLISCGPDRLDDYSGDSYELVNQNGETVVFPDDFEGNPVFVGFIYTHCPDICSFITSNLKKVHDELDSDDDTQFILITFDPERDTPDVLKSYASAFDMDTEPYHFLTGDTETIDELMRRVNVRTNITDELAEKSDQDIYFINHSDKILLIDSRSRLVFDYGGSMTPVEIFIEDHQKL